MGRIPPRAVQLESVFNKKPSDLHTCYSLQTALLRHIRDCVPGSDPAQPELMDHLWQTRGPLYLALALQGMSAGLIWPGPFPHGLAGGVGLEGVPQDCGTAGQKLHAHGLSLPSRPLGP